MDFSGVVGFENSKKGLKHSIDSGRLPHAQLFVSEENGSTLPLVFWMLTQLFKGDSKVPKLIHPDIHLLFPTSNTIGVSSKNVRSSDQLNDFRSAILENPYLTYGQWISKNSSAGGSSSPKRCHRSATGMPPTASPAPTRPPRRTQPVTVFPTF